MEFFRYEKYMQAVGEHGTVASPVSDSITSYTIEGDDIWSIELGGSDGEHTIGFAVSPEALPQRIEDVLHATGIAEAAIIPRAQWRDILDLAAFELATDEHWQDIDAEAALHMNGRDPLALLPDRFHIVQTMVKSIIEHGDSEKESLAIVASDAPITVEVRADGTATVRCMHEATAREIVKKLH